MSPAADRDASIADARREREVERDEVRRFTRSSRRRRRLLVGIVASVAALLLFVAVAVFSPIMAVREIRVEGTSRLDATAVGEVLADLDGRPLALVTTNDVATRLAGFVLVQSWSKRAVPPSTLVVDIVERQPIGALERDGQWAVYDAAGVELWRAPEAPADVPTLDLGGGDTSSPAFAAAAQVSLALPADFRVGVASVTARTFDDVTLQLRDGTSVVWGSGEDSARKVEVLLALMSGAPAGGVSQYDVSSPESPVTR
ncbi:FtsQ-type POTRA domain-containing protein [Pseudoclavibacter chungangensis]|uniref:FtsQ-type POTRA domain-containing protein n=1 Tax=Pseudoclavibacter chungangensis TaxID=587635 RepID=A0A7J5C1Z1_9MICO|nr:FtsQ-type POTRA domain-containing protein [Pseudoclavibacter chungangensis]KAB1660110.1 FtsQ-type POTRA domain-containing protein [Pseudoclavibacter chungangensis]NYJ66785.1 cell division protein FtsQ [Pseudoclavibacter chungangensis]